MHQVETAHGEETARNIIFNQSNRGSVVFTMLGHRTKRGWPDVGCRRRADVHVPTLGQHQLAIWKMIDSKVPKISIKIRFNDILHYLYAYKLLFQYLVWTDCT